MGRIHYPWSFLVDFILDAKPIDIPSCDNNCINNGIIIIVGSIVLLVIGYICGQKERQIN